jgi:Domain of unknown function (DUF4384)/PEGA domain
MTHIAKRITALALSTTIIAASLASAAPRIDAQSIIVNPIENDLKVKAWVDKDTSGNNAADYYVGEKIKLNVKVNQDAYVYLFDVNANGEVVQILPNKLQNGGNLLKAGEQRVFPDASRGDRYDFAITAPYGLSKVLALASKTPLDLEQLNEFKNGRDLGGGLTEITITTNSGLAQALSIVVSPVGDRNWTSDTAFYNVVQSRPAARTGTLQLSSNPSGADVYVDDTFVGISPLSRTEISEGRHTVRISQDGYNDFITTVEIARGRTLKLDATLRAQVRTGSLKLTSNVRNASVFIEGRKVGNAPLDTDLNAGTYNIRVTAPGYDDYTGTVTIRSGVAITQNITLNSQQVTVNLRANVDNGQVYLDGVPQGGLVQGGLSFSVPRGVHELVIISSGYRAYVKNIDFQSSGTVTANLGRLN